jgi:hypothetical protein
MQARSLWSSGITGRVVPARLLLGATLVLALGCPRRQPAADASKQAAKLSAEESGPKIAAAVQRGDYVEALALTERTALPQPQLDHAAGMLILDSVADPQASTRPAVGVQAGIARVEAAALAGYEDAPTSLAALFHTGLSERGENVKLAPQPALEECWRQVEAGARKAAECVELRRQSAP